MLLISNNCDEIKLFLTEYARNQLTTQENKDIEEHLASCNDCRIENEILKSLSIETDKLIPAVSRAYEKSLVYNLFIKKQTENIIVKALSLVLILFLVLFIFSSFFQPKTNYITLNALKFRAENIFNQEYYSGLKKDEN
jgi:hypothetical protein